MEREKGIMNFEAVFFQLLFDPSVKGATSGSFVGSMIGMGSSFFHVDSCTDKVRRRLTCAKEFKTAEPVVYTSEAKELERFLHVLRVFFNKYDVDKSGHIDDTELGLLLKDLRLPNGPSQVQRLIQIMDVDHDGQISFKEFVVGVRLIMDAVQQSRKSSVLSSPHLDRAPRGSNVTGGDPSLPAVAEHRVSVPSLPDSVVRDTPKDGSKDSTNPVFNYLTASARSLKSGGSGSGTHLFLFLFLVEKHLRMVQQSSNNK